MSNQLKFEKLMNQTKTDGRVLIVDDDTSVIASIQLLLKQHGYQSEQATSPDEAKRKLASVEISLVVQDMNFSRSTSGDEGLQLLRQLKSIKPDIPVLLLTAWGSIELAVEGIKSGAVDFLTKPWNNHHLFRSIETCLQLNRPENSQCLDRKALDQQYDFSKIVADDPKMLEILSIIGRVAQTDAPILILGESGTGKELIADAIHANSKRKNNALVKVNLGGLTSSLFESEMFGHVKGAFTDAKQDRIGRFEMANEGTIFLDEIGDLDSASQVKLLRVLQDQSFQSVGSSKTRHSDFRVISATNRSLEDMVSNNEFREDLLYRLNLITIEIPPLRKRRCDILAIANEHLKKIGQLYSLKPLSLQDDALRWLESQPWPGNIRQLTQTIERTVLMSGAELLGATDFIAVNIEEKQSTLTTGEVIEAGGMRLDDMEKLMITKALIAYDRNMTKVAVALGISRAALYRRIEKHGIDL